MTTQGQQFPLIEVSGASYEMGYQHGAQAAPLVRKYLSWIEKLTGEPRDVLCRNAMSFFPSIRALSPSLVEEIEGLAEGAGGGLEHGLDLVVVVPAPQHVEVERDPGVLGDAPPEVLDELRREVADGMRTGIQEKAGDRIEVIEVFLRDVQAPTAVRQAIDEKLQREQQVAAEKFQTEIIQERALQEIERAKGIAEAQRIISVGLSPEYLMFHYIEQLGTLPAGSVVYVPTEGSIPLMRNVGGGSN